MGVCGGGVAIAYRDSLLPQGVWLLIIRLASSLREVATTVLLVSQIDSLPDLPQCLKGPLGSAILEKLYNMRQNTESLERAEI